MDRTTPKSETLPQITLSSRDAKRLRALAESFAGRPYALLTEFLNRELARAQIRAPSELPPNVVTMRSRVRFRLDDPLDVQSDVRVVTLVYPGEEDGRTGHISVLSTIGSALIGLREGDCIQWQSLDGRDVGLTVIKVLYQPEAHGRDLE